ncbi:MAG: ATP-dependent sacrificial sulfur transferase LarE [Candidatus Margulisiibacteriota bacterium]
MRKLDILKDILKDMKSVLVAYSGGVDSAYLLKIAVDTLDNDKVLAVTASSETYPDHEKKEARELCEKLGAKAMVIETREFDDPNFRSNPKDRCYYCKKELFSKLTAIMKENNLAFIIDGSNADDLNDFRPGAKAKKELGVRSPLQEAELTKEEIRSSAKAVGLSNWDKPSSACLASRIPYGTEIVPEVLQRIEKAEDYLRSLGFKQLRVRHHDKLARIEIESHEIPVIMKGNMMGKINKKFDELGYIYVTLDLKGYRTGSLNEAINE